MRTLLARTLERLGYVVETAEDPSVALRPSVPVVTSSPS